MQYFVEQHGIQAKEIFQISSRMYNHSFPSHLHRAYELVCVDKGAITLYVDQKKYTLTAGNLAFIFCNQIHGYFSLGTEIFVVQFSPEIIKDFYSAYKEYVPVNNIIKIPEGLDFYKLNSIYSKKSVLYALCDNLLNHTEMSPMDSHLHSIIHIPQKIFAYVEEHFSEDCTLKNVADALQYDYAYLSKLFTRFVGIPFTVHLNNYRISQACVMLNSVSEPISEIAEQCGYKNSRTFHRNFRKIMGCSPQDYRSFSPQVFSRR